MQQRNYYSKIHFWAKDSTYQLISGLQGIVSALGSTEWFFMNENANITLKGNY